MEKSTPNCNPISARLTLPNQVKIDLEPNRVRDAEQHRHTGSPREQANTGTIAMNAIPIHVI